MSVQIIKKWGNSPALCIPDSVMQAAHLSLEQAVEVRAENGRIIIEPQAPSYRLDDLLAEITEDNCHAEIDFGPAQGKESW